MKTRTVSTLLASVVLLAAAGTAVSALPIVYVASYGSDSNPGTITQPCLTFGGAYAKTDTGGEIKVLNAGNYHPSTDFLEIYKSITIDGGAGQMGMLTAGLAVDAGTVTLRNLSFNGSYDGIDVGVNASLVVDKCTFNCTNSAITIVGSGNNLNVLHSTINGSHRGIWVEPNVSPDNTTLDDVNVTNTSGAAIFVESGTLDIKNSTLTDCYEGVVADTGGTIQATNDTLSHDVLAVISNTGSTIGLSNDDILDNTFGIYLAGSPAGTVTSASNNRFVGNSSDGSNPTGSITIK